MNDEEEDFLWSCELLDHTTIERRKDRQWIIPDQQDLFVGREYGDGLYIQTYNVEGSRSEMLTEEYVLKFELDAPFGSILLPREIQVKILEEHGQGVCDVIGGEVWEAALLLCSYLLLERSDVIGGPIHYTGEAQYEIYPPSILELGSGVGLPILLIAHLRQLYQSQQSLAVHQDKNHLAMTDYDLELAENLSESVKSQFIVSLQNEGKNCVDEEDDLVDSEWEEYQQREKLAKTSKSSTEEEKKQHSSSLLTAGQLNWEIFLPTNNSVDHNYSISEEEDYEETGYDGENSISNISHDSVPQASNKRVPDIFHHSQFDFLIGSALCYTSSHAKSLARVISYYLDPSSFCHEIIVIQIHDREGFQTLIELIKQSPHIDYEIQPIAEKVHQYANSIQRSLVPSDCSQSLTVDHDRSLHYINYMFPPVNSTTNVTEPLSLSSKYKHNMIQTDINSFVLLRIFKRKSDKPLIR